MIKAFYLFKRLIITLIMIFEILVNNDLQMNKKKYIN